MDDLTNGPDEADQLAGHSDGGHHRSLSAAGHPEELPIQALIASTGDIEQFLGLILAPALDCWSVRDSSLIVPGCLYGDSPDMGVAGLGDRQPSSLLSRALLGRHQPHRCHQLWCRWKAPQIAELGQDRHRRERVDRSQFGAARGGSAAGPTDRRLVSL